MTSLPMSTTPEIVSNYIKNHSSSTPTLKDQLNQSEVYPLETNFLKTDYSKYYSHKHSEDSFKRSDFGNDNKCPWITKRQILVLSLINFAFFCQASCYALLAPFFPEEAEKKQLSSTQYGFVFGIFHFVVFILSPFMCNMVSTLSPKFLINSGVFFTGGATILLGTVIKSSPGATFFSLSLLGRIVQAMGSTALFTLGYTIVANEFTERRATVLAIVEMFYGLGITIGPTIGGVLFEVGGFMLPFFLLGAILVCLSAIMICFLPETKCTMNENEGELWKIIFNPTFIVDMVNILTGFLIVGFNEATLEPHVRQLGLTPSVVGLLFIASGGIYAVGTPVWGYVYDKIPDSYITMYTSSIVCAASFLLLGPAPFLPLETLRGFPDDIPTLTIVSGIFNCTLALGGFIGPSIGGTLLDHMGYENGTMVLLGIELAVIKIASRLTIDKLLLLVGDNNYTFNVDINNQILWTIRGIKTYSIKWFFAVMKKYLL
ncbi:MFS-type transporter SLC18B1-like isoform X3 [Tachypleus tridentatus]|uniref:MFS-type transporter SLC18B1-like isoform X3 n=1 Tax=Tachypleus tridentatus TaxID=6853 RepID=UPI003FD1FEE0